jgi:predicted 3-demethylubiquinone-9 3-methyltransferase (glyoxalase superfamily)
MGLNGGTYFTLTPAVSLVVTCKTQEEIDKYWDKLLEGGKEMQCGWLTDKYGLSWQIVPEAFFKMLEDTDKKKVQRVMDAMMKMVKFDIATLKEAYENESVSASAK